MFMNREKRGKHQLTKHRAITVSIGTHKHTSATVRHGINVFNPNTNKLPMDPLTLVYAINIPRLVGSLEINQNLYFFF